MRLRLRIPQVKTAPLLRPRGCRWCGSVLLQRHQAVPKTVIDTHVRETQAVRYRCVDCGRTFRQYADGVSRARQSQRVAGLAVVLWALGLSEWTTSSVLVGLEAGIHRSTVHRDRLIAGALLQRRATLPAGLRVLGADETVVRVRGQAQVVGFVVDGESGKTVGVDVLLGQDATAFLRWLEPYVRALGVEVLVTDDLATYKPVSLQLGLRHQVCLTHVRKWVAHRLRQIEGWEDEQSVVREIVRVLPPDGGTRLMALEKRVRGSPELRRLVVDLLQRWPALVCHQGRAGVPATNNPTEQAIGKSKVRFKTARGFGSLEGALTGIALTQWLYDGAETHNLADLAA